MKIDIQDHMLVPKHEIMTEEEISEEFSDVDYDFKKLPKKRRNRLGERRNQICDRNQKKHHLRDG